MGFLFVADFINEELFYVIIAFSFNDIILTLGSAMLV